MISSSNDLAVRCRTTDETNSLDHITSRGGSHLLQRNDPTPPAEWEDESMIGVKNGIDKYYSG